MASAWSVRQGIAELSADTQVIALQRTFVIRLPGPGCHWPMSLAVPSLAVTEVCHLLADPARRGRAGLAAEFCAAIADDELRVNEITPHDYRRMAELLPGQFQGCHRLAARPGM
jgi:hypothetical protein